MFSKHSLFSFLALSLALPAVAQGPAPTLAERAAAIDAPAVGRALAAEQPIEVGRGRFAGGSLRLLTALGEPVGVLVSGGRFDYRVDDRFSLPVARRNVKRASSLAPAEEGGALTLGVEVANAAIWNRALAGALAAAHPAPQDAAPATAAALPGEIRDMLTNRLFSAPSVDLLSGGEEVVYALIDGTEDDLVLWLDPARADEGLAALSRLSGRARDFRGSWVLSELVTQPVGRPWWEAPKAAVRSVHTSISLRNEGGREVDFVTRTTLRAERGGTAIWYARLADELYDEGRVDDVVVSRVLVDGRPADHLHHDGSLLVDLGRPLAAGETTIVEVAHSGPFAVRPNNDSYWSLSTWPWYPQPAAHDGQFSSFEIEMRTPDPFVPRATGTTVERREEKVTTAGGKEETFHVLLSRLDRPTHLPVVAAGRYHLFTESKDGIECNVASYAFGKERPAAILHDIFFSAAAIFEQFYGVPYPFAEVDVVEINSWGFGQAPAGVIFITQEAFNPLSSTTSRFFSQGVNGRFVHEVAHAWWGHVVKTGAASEEWLAESFADYSAALAMRAMKPGRAGEREFASTLREWKANAERVGEGGSIYLANHLAGGDERDSADRYYLLYNKGPLVLHAMRQELARQLGSAEQGDRYFQALLRTLVTQFENQYGETRHLVGILNQMTGNDWQPWFERYVYGTEMPEVEM